jgi:apolipoprotein N-acyltransferase
VRERSLQVARRSALPILGGALVAASLPPIGIWPLAIAGVAILSRCLEGMRWGSRLLTGLCAGLGQFALSLLWALHFSSAGYVVLVVAESLFVALACALTPPGRGRVPALVGLLVLAEFARQTWPFGGLPMGGIALGQAAGPLAQAARLGGPLLVAGVTYLAGIAVGELARRPSMRSIAGLVALLVAGGFVLGGVLAPDGGPNLKTVSVAVVQGGGKRGLDQLQVPASVVYQAALSPTEQLAGNTQLVLWPEDVVSLAGPLAGSPEEKTLAALSHRLHTTLLAGVTVPVGTSGFLNEIVAFGPKGTIVAVFEKVHRVPFGEYVPFRGFFKHFANLSDIPRDAVPGHGSGMISTPAGPLAVLVSYEVFYPDRARSGVRAGGELIVVPTNTSSYSSDQAPAQEVAASRLQAISEGRYVLQAAPTGYSAVIDADGNVLTRSDLSAEDVIETKVPLRKGSTPYEQWGDLPLLVLSGLAALAGWALAWRDQRARQVPEPVTR